jgi:hypothetical protein
MGVLVLLKHLAVHGQRGDCLRDGWARGSWRRRNFGLVFGRGAERHGLLAPETPVYFVDIAWKA